MIWLKRWLDSFRPIYWLRCHLFTRYHIINIKGMDDYSWGWIDTDHRILLAVFKLFCEFVEEEYLQLPKSLDEDYHNELMAIYIWWTHDRPLEKNLIDQYYTCHSFNKKHCQIPNHLEDIHKLYGSPYMAREALDKKDNEMLLRVMAIRPRLWT